MTHPFHAPQAIQFAINLLKGGLSPQLAYHNLWHTTHEVLPGSALFAHHSSISEVDQHLLSVAAAFHDVGFTQSYANHEIIGIRIAVRVLPDFGFTGAHIDRIKGMILATRIPQSPQNLLEEILADADLDVLGRADFLARNDALRQEWTNYGRATSPVQWYESQVNFLRNHTYFTPVARRLRDEQKKENLAALEDILQSVKIGTSPTSLDPSSPS